MQDKENREDIIKGDTRAKGYLVLLCLLSIIWVVAIHTVDERITSESYFTLQKVLWLVGPVTIVTMGGVAAYLYRVGIRIYKSHCYPPPGMRVPFTMKIRRDRKANQMAYLCFIAATSLFLNMLVQVWALIMVVKINKGI